MLEGARECPLFRGGLEKIVKYKLYLDDQINDPNTPSRHPPEGFIGAASTLEAKTLVEMLGLPEFMDLDHDLGGDDTAEKFVKWLCFEYQATSVPEFSVHSANPIGKENLTAFLNSWKKSLEK